SNFLLWQAAYSEFYISELPWPDFTTEELHRALELYSKRERRFGRVPLSPTAPPT
ncbi:MAG: undecaprenyl diphosphate synthase family protein, partial [Bdellovibrionia bacterium]